MKRGDEKKVIFGVGGQVVMKKGHEKCFSDIVFRTRGDGRILSDCIVRRKCDEKCFSDHVSHDYEEDYLLERKAV
jgi:hypothetical protein